MKPLDQFNIDISTKDGRAIYCRSCRSARRRQRIQTTYLSADASKRCSKCGSEKPVTEFYKNAGTSDGLHSWCGECCRQAKQKEYRLDPGKHVARSAEWQRANADKANARNRKFQRFTARGITPYEAQCMLYRQFGRCAICQSEILLYTNDAVRIAHVDHSHKTGNVRGLLCKKCNSVLGMARDSISILQSAINYLECREHVLCGIQVKQFSDLEKVVPFRFSQYGITAQDAYALLEQQQHKCAICDTVIDLWSKDKSLVAHVDHDHVSGLVRGILCVRCNILLGMARDSVKVLRLSVDYLQTTTVAVNYPIDDLQGC